MSSLHFLIVTAAVALLLASFATWTAVVLRVAAGKIVLPAEVHTPPPWGLVDLLFTAVAMICSQALAIGLVRQFFAISGDIPFEQIASGPRAALLLAGSLATLTACLLSVAWVVARCGASRHDLGVGTGSIAADIRLGVTAFVMLAPLVYAMQWLLVQVLESKHPLLELLKQDPDPKFFAVSVVSAVLAAPLAEEYLFRVLLQGWLERISSPDGQLPTILWGRRACPGVPRELCDGLPPSGLSADWAPPALTEQPPVPCGGDRDIFDPQGPAGELSLETSVESRVVRSWPVLVSAFLFALAHWSHGPDPIPLFVLAVGLGVIYQRTHRILPCIVVHLLLNSVSLVVLWLTVYFQLE